MSTGKRWMILFAMLWAFVPALAGCSAGSETSVESLAENDTGAAEEAGTEKLETAPENDTEKSSADSRRATPEKVKGIYVSGPVAGTDRMEELIALTDATELNAMVIDIKNDDGNITYKMELDLAQELGACVGYIPDIGALMAELKAHGIYTIARIVCFKDPFLAAGRPELALRKPDGAAVADANGLAFVNPYREEVWEYLVDVALEASAVGFDEIQFDYIRFPIGEDADAAEYGVDAAYTKEQTITDFFSYAAERLHREGVVFGADVFGTIIGSEADVRAVGQNYQTIGGVVDVLCPMVYPSHYAAGAFDLKVPDAQPYETVLGALQWSGRELAEVEESRRAAVRPWLQCFTATWVPGHIAYEAEEIQQQIQAVYDAGYEEWILWNASSRYPADAF